MSDLAEEQWLPVVGFEGLYAVSNYGRVRREKPGCNTFSGRILKPLKHGRTPHSYLGVVLVKKDPTRRTPAVVKKRGIHSLVMEAFVGPRPPGCHVNHKSGDKKNNFLENLEYLSMEDNIAHGKQFGSRGESCTEAKLTEKDVLRIRQRFHVNGEGVDTIRKDFPQVCRGTVYNVATGMSWRHIPLPETTRKLWNAERKEYHPKRKGTDNARALLTEAQVLDARRRFDVGDVSVAALAREYGLKYSAMARLIRRKSWTHLP